MLLIALGISLVALVISIIALKHNLN